jgi:hypothetical protein
LKSKRKPPSTRKATSKKKGAAAPHVHSHAHGRDERDGHGHGDGHDHDHEHEHGHDHDHTAGHGHGHGHGHDHDHGTLVLAKGAGRGKLLFLDAPSGLAGDMIIAALVDLGVPEKVIEDAVAKLPVKGFHVHFGMRERSGIVATSFEVHVAAKQPERTYGAIRAMIESSALEPRVKARAQATFRRLAEAESRVHRIALDDVHFHEVGAIDAIVDVVGSAAAIEYLGARLVVSPLPMGHGRVKARHGVLPLPAPATVECLRGIPTYDAGIAFEFVTPTGAAIVGAHAEPGPRWPRIAPERTGWGAGSADIADRPNLLRVVLGEGGGALEAAPRATHVVLEANLDDATGELLGSCIDALLSAGALDAWAVPLTMKKGRPAFLLGAIAPVGLGDDVASAMLRESTTLGVRRHEVTRLERPRRTAEVDTRFGRVPVKISEGPYGPPQRKPEFDACLALARIHGVPVREVLEAAMLAASASSL